MIPIWTLLIAFLFVFYLNEFLDRKRRKVPPGPWPFPVIGNIHQLAMAHSRPDLAVATLSAKYGEIYKLKVGLSELDEAVRSVLMKKEAMGRDLRGTLFDRNKGIHSGLALNEGPKWEKMRSWTIKNLKDYGFNKTSSMEASILEDIDLMFQKTEESLNRDGTGIVSVRDWLQVPVFKFVWKLLVGHYSPKDEIMLQGIIRKSEEMMKNGIMGVGLVNAFPFLRFLFPNATGRMVSISFYDESYKVAGNLLREAGSQVIGTPDNFIQAFAKKMQEISREDDDNCFTEHDFGALFMDLINGGSDTSTSFLESFILHMVHHPDVQAKVYAEISDIIPHGEPVSFSYSKLMPYTQAVMLEVHRHTKVLQHFIPRRALKDVTFKDYIIPKGTTIMTDVHTIYNCPKNLNDPEEFKPERFIGPKGEFVKHPSVIPFSIGKRNCMAENFADVSSFLFSVSVLRKYELSPVRGESLPRKDMQVGLTSKPYPFNVTISIRRTNVN